MIYHGICTLHLGAVFLEESSQERVGVATNLLQPLLKVFKIKQPQYGHEIVLVIGPRQLQQLRNHGAELLGLFGVGHVAVIPVESLSGDHSHYAVERHVVELGSEFHFGEVAGRVLGELVHEHVSLVLSDSGEVVDAVGGEDVEGGDAAEVAPVLAVGGGA
ncbi:hypothetical protein CR513_19698, partial [Mucuna pruriens]